MALTIQDVLRRYSESFLTSQRVPGFMRQAVWRLRDCRTARMGFHVRRCPQGHVQQTYFNSCKHRSCPQCGWMQTERWLAVEKERLLRCSHFHVVFTIPAELRTLWRWNRAEFGKLLFRASAESLQELLADPKYLGARPGMLLAQHTWTKRLALHPHIHALVTGGGLTHDGRWLSTRARWLLPQKVLTAKYRGKLRALLLASLTRGTLRVPAGQSAAQMRGLLNRLGRQHVNVKILERYEHGVGVATYLARYLRGGPLSNRRLVSLRAGQVTFRYLDRRRVDVAGRPTQQFAQLPVLDFIQAYLQHVPPQGFTTVRRYGLYANNKVAELNVARAELKQPAWQKPERPSWADLLEKMDSSEPARCPVCCAELVCQRIATPIRGSPLTERRQLDVGTTRA
ncbi:MAG: transposase [Pirellulales bacterium]